MDWDDFRYVLEVERAGSLSDAAVALGVVRTTVGRRIKALEESLGVRLFDRTPEGFVPTAAGQEIARAAERLEVEVLDTRGKLLGRDAELRGRLRVSMLGFIYDNFFDVFASFMERYPGVDVTICATTREVSLMRREADVVLRLNSAPAERLAGVRLGVMQFAPYASRALVEEVGHDARLGEFPWLHWDERSDGRWLDEWLAEHAPGARVVMRTDDYPVIRASVARGLGVHFLPCFDGDADPDLICVGPRPPEFTRALWLLTLPDLRTNSRVRAFMDHTKEAFRELRPELGASPP